MKKIKCYLQAVIIICLSFYACNGFLDEPEPVDQFPIDQVFNNAEDLESALVGTYDLIQHGDLLGGNVWALSDVYAYNAEGWFTEVSTLAMPATHWMTERLWTRAYRAVNLANAILDALPEVMINDASFAMQDAGRMEGEALFIRAVIHFELARLYAKPYSAEFLQDCGIPLMLEPILLKGDIVFPARATIGEVYNQVLSDLEKAHSLLPETNARGRATRFAALAYLSRIAFQKRDYSTAAAQAKEVLDRSDLFELTSTPQEFFTVEGSAEEIWVIYGSGANDPIVGGLPSVYNDAPTTATISNDLKKNGYQAILTPSQKYEIQDAGFQFVDLRCDPANLLSEGNLLVTNPDSSKCNKYEDGYTLGEDDAPVLRLAELILIRAEALVQNQGINEESISLLNQIRHRSLRVMDSTGVVVPGGNSLIEYRAADFADTDELMEAIIRERRVELAFEGHYLHDLMRLKRPVLNGINEYSFDANELRLPIPQRELDANQQLVQNPCD